MRDKHFLFTLLQTASAFFVNLSAGYFFAIYATQNMWVLLNDVIVCIVCLVIAIYLAKFVRYE